MKPAVLDTSRFAGPDFSEEEAYWLGFLFTDGCLHGRTVIVDLQGADQKHVAKFAKFLGCERTPIIRTALVNCALNAPKAPRETTYARFSVASKVFSDNLRLCGMHERKTWTITPWSGPDHLMRHFWRGCVDGDGSIVRVHSGSVGKKFNPRIIWNLFYCGNPAMVAGFSDFVENNIGYKTTLVVKKPNKHGHRLHALTYSEKPATAIMRLLYDEATVALDRKIERVHEALAMRSTRKGVRPPLTCTIPGCTKPRDSHDACSACWRRIKNGGPYCLELVPAWRRSIYVERSRKWTADKMAA